MTGSRDGWREGEAYESYMGRWSRPLALHFISLLALAAARRDQGDAAGARELLRPAVAHPTPTLGPAHPAVTDARRQLGR
jgi:hypothetical protein